MRPKKEEAEEASSTLPNKGAFAAFKQQITMLRSLEAGRRVLHEAQHELRFMVRVGVAR